NIAFMVGLAFAIAASCNFPIILLSMYWSKLTTRGAMLGGWLGLLTAVVLMILGPTIWVQILGHKGVLRLGIPPMVGMLMAGPISLFRQRYPGVELKISEFGGLTVQQAVMNGELDVAMTALPVEEASGLTT
ncbi:hypothetical protein SEEB2780_06950, partial [Salmonella enterica subsp. enterica serovar Bareilly str. 2780]